MEAKFSDRFDEFFQKHYVAHILSDTAFLQRVKDDLLPEQFTSDQAQKLVRMVLAFEAEHKAAPGELIFQEIENIKTRQNVSDSALAPLLLYIQGLIELPLQNRNFLLKEHDRFVRHQNFVTSFPKISSAVKKGNFDVVEKILKDTLIFRPSEDLSPGTHFTADPTERILRRTQSEGEKFWLGIPELDKVVEPLGRGELGVLQSQRSSMGKTAALVHFTKSFVFQGYKVLIFTLEEGEDRYQDRIDMCVAGVTKDELINKYKIEKEIHRWFGNGGDVWIKQFPGRMVKVSDLQKFTTYLANVHNFVPDVILVDYADELLPENAKHESSPYATGGEVYSMLRGWAVKEDVCLWTATQSNRSAAQAVVADMEHVAGSIAKMFIADLVVSINRSKTEQEEGMTRLFVVKQKSGSARFEITIHSDFTTMHFYKVAKP